ncbi:MAG: RNA polymerase sigma factor, partial [Candidatus Izemoplasmatales bacterium]
MNTNLEALVKKIKLGDDEAFPKLYNLTYRQIFFVIIPITKNQALAEDIVQDTYLKFLKKIDDYKAKNVLSYLITIAKNMAINEYNRLKRVTKVDDFDSFSY